MAHETEHLLQSDHDDSLQSIGQAKVEHVVDELKVGQATPPLAAAVMMERVLVFEPVPQVLEQAP